MRRIVRSSEGERQRRPSRAPSWYAIAALVLCVASCASSGNGAHRRQIERGAIACEHPLATAVGLEILERGGNAADAAVATALALAVVYPQAGNLGGGGFALWVPAEGTALALDYREVAPASTLVGRYLDIDGNVVPERSIMGPLAVGVPGTPLGLFELHRKCGSGRLTFAELVRPAARLARDGFAVDPWLALHLQETRGFAFWNDAARELFYPGGSALEEGDLFRQPALADTLERLGRGGPDAFYTGGVASALVHELNGTGVPGLERPSGGSVDLADLASYEVVWRVPLHGWFLGHELYSMPPPSSGGLVVMQSLAVLEGMPLEAERTGTAGEVPTERMLHWWIEALRGSFADRAEHLGDPDHVTLPMRELLSPEWGARRRAAIGESADVDIGAWTAPLPVESTETTHISIVDSAGNALSMTTTLNGLFGSGILVREGGFLLNNQLDDFAIQAGAPNMYGLVGSSANVIAAHKRPLSSMTPTVLRTPDGHPELVLGSPGGPRIITSVVQVLLRVLVLEQSLTEAVDAPRLHQQWRPKETLLELDFHGGFDPRVVDALVRRGHPVRLTDERFGSVQAIAIDSAGEPHAYSDPRRGGAAAVEGGEVSIPARPPILPATTKP